MRNRYLPVLAWLTIMRLPSIALAQPVGPEFQVNTYTTGNQSAASVASDPTGNFVVVWESYFKDSNSLTAVFGQRYDSAGNALGPEFQVSNLANNHQQDPSVASDMDGNFVVVWGGAGQGDEYGVFGQRYDRDGNRLGNEFHVNTFTTGIQWRSSVATDATGNFVVVWEGGGSQDGDYYGIFGQRYSRDGNPVGVEFQVNTYTTGFQRFPAVTLDPSGNSVAVWMSYGQGGPLWNIFGQRFDEGGNAVGPEFQVDTQLNSGSPSLSSDADGNFIVVWGSGDGILGRRYDSDGNPLGAEFPLNVGNSPSFSSDANGNFVVVSRREPYGQAYGDISGRRYDINGNPIGGAFQVNTYTTGRQSYPSVASDAIGNFLVVWQDANRYEDGHDGNLGGVFGQRFSAACEASLHVQGDVHAPGSTVALQVHIAHRRPKTVTVPWELRLLDADGQELAKRTTEPLTFEPGDVVDREVAFRLPDDLAAGTYMLELAIGGMDGTKGATTTVRVIQAE
jgi:hypothetical protein